MPDPKAYGILKNRKVAKKSGRLARMTSHKRPASVADQAAKSVAPANRRIPKKFVASQKNSLGKSEVTSTSFHLSTTKKKGN